MTYTVHSYARESLPFLGHIEFTQDVDTEEDARRIAKEIHDRGNDIKVHVTKGKEVLFYYAEVTQQRSR
jgi:hypothetical protein